MLIGGVQLPAAMHFPLGWVRERWEVGGVRRRGDESRPSVVALRTFLILPGWL